MRDAAAVLLSFTTLAMAADWASYRGDAHFTANQTFGKQITVQNVQQLKLLWKQPLDQTSTTTPLIMGPTITHRGVRELVFIGTRDNLYAFDADLGTLFWKRSIDGLSATPAFEPDPDEADRGEDEPGPMRPLYVLSSDGRLHAIRVSDGADIAAYPFLPASTKTSNLNIWRGTIYAGTAEGIWSLKPGGKPKSRPTAAPLGVIISQSGHAEPVTTQEIRQASNDAWSYVAGDRNIQAFRNRQLVWTADIDSPSPPVILNGIVFALSGGALKAFDGASGKELYNRPVPTVQPSLAVGNGHLCFAGDALVCFGIPIER